jgi:hypothetical protein
VRKALEAEALSATVNEFRPAIAVLVTLPTRFSALPFAPTVDPLASTSTVRRAPALATLTVPRTVFPFWLVAIRSPDAAGAAGPGAAAAIGAGGALPPEAGLGVGVAEAVAVGWAVGLAVVVAVAVAVGVGVGGAPVTVMTPIIDACRSHTNS